MKTARTFILSAILFCFIPLSGATGQPRSATVAINGARMYDRPSVIGERRADVPIATAVRVLDEADEWYVVRIGDVVGWMPAASLALKGSSSTTSSSIKLGVMDGGGGTTRSSSSGRVYTRGPRGGCYYINGSGRKVYVDHSFCN